MKAAERRRRQRRQTEARARDTPEITAEGGGASALVWAAGAAASRTADTSAGASNTSIADTVMGAGKKKVFGPAVCEPEYPRSSRYGIS